MPTFATVINKGGTDKTVITNVRAGVIQPFQAPDWTDLRVGFLLSLTQAAADDTITGLAETISGGLLDMDQRYWIGVKDRSAQFPKYDGTVFIGFTNASIEARRPESIGGTVLSTSDEAIGTTNANFWRPNNSAAGSSNWSGGIWDGPVNRAISGDGVQQHFVQNTAGAGGYATLLMLRLQRDDFGAGAKRITVTVKQGTHSGDVLFTNTPTEALLLANLEAFPTTVQQWGPVNLSAVPDALYLYWPFRNSRLRYHAMGILKTR